MFWELVGIGFVEESDVDTTVTWWTPHQDDHCTFWSLPSRNFDRVIRSYCRLGWLMGILYKSSLMLYKLGVPMQSTLNHQSHTLANWLNTVPLGHRKLYFCPLGRHQCQTCKWESQLEFVSKTNRNSSCSVQQQRAFMSTWLDVEVVGLHHMLCVELN